MTFIESLTLFLKVKSMNKNIFLILLLLSIFIVKCFALTVEDFKMQYNIGEETQLFTDDKIVFSVGNDDKFVLRKLNPYYDNKVRTPWHEQQSDQILEFVESEMYYFLLCIDEKHILLFFDDERNYFQKYQDKMQFELHGDYSKVRAYYIYFPTYLKKFTEERYNRIFSTDIVWVDKKNNGWCGSFTYPPMTFNETSKETEQGREYCDYVKDFYVNVIDKEIDRCQIFVEKKEDFQFHRHTTYEAAYCIMTFDLPLGQELLNRLSKLSEYEQINFYLSYGTSLKLSFYCMTVNEFQSIFREVGLGSIADTKPGFDTLLPRNEGELDNFIKWKISCYQTDYTEMLDAYDNPIDFEIVPEGLKAISAGPDKEFGTDDDIVFVRTYESVGMKPLS